MTKIEEINLHKQILEETYGVKTQEITKNDAKQIAKSLSEIFNF